MTGLATSSGPTLLGKLRALDKSLSATDGPFDPTWLDELADLLPQIIAQIERDAKDAARLEFLAGRPMVVEFRQDGPGTVLGFVVPDIRVNNNARDNIDRAIDAAKERT